MFGSSAPPNAHNAVIAARSKHSALLWIPPHAVDVARQTARVCQHLKGRAARQHAQVVIAPGSRQLIRSRARPVHRIHCSFVHASHCRRAPPRPTCRLALPHSHSLVVRARRQPVTLSTTNPISLSVVCSHLDPKRSKATSHTVDSCPSSVSRQYQSSSPSSHSLMVSSYEHEASRASVGCHTTDLTSC